MEILIGVDEAGYGPNLGPLVVAATVWCVHDMELAVQKSAISIRRTVGDRQGTNGDLYDRLDGVVARRPADGKLAIADSKLLYKPGCGLKLLERGVHAALVAMDRPARNWTALVDILAADPGAHSAQLAWYDEFECRLPIDAIGDDVMEVGTRLKTIGLDRQASLLDVRAHMVHAAQFNELVEYYGTKGAALSHITMALVRRVADCVQLRLPPAAKRAHQSNGLIVRILCDKHGGRSRYVSLLQHHFSDHWIETVRESQAESHYCWGSDDATYQCTFRVGGEVFLPTALASMTAKYIRELAMRAFNQFWCSRTPGLKPTAGYPADAGRFKSEIAALQQQLGIEDHVIWRKR
jgi:ribonuclease HII